MILNYLRKNPNAGDTVEGISRWWLEIERIDNTVDDVMKALESLIHEGSIKEHKSIGGVTFYKVN